MPPNTSVVLLILCRPVNCRTNVCVAEVPTSVFGDKLREQVEERLSFYETGDVPRKNVDVMKAAVKEVTSSGTEKHCCRRKVIGVTSAMTVCLCCE